jgi:hypothetical protein
MLNGIAVLCVCVCVERESIIAMQHKLVALTEEWARALLRTRQAATSAGSLQRSEISVKDLRFLSLMPIPLTIDDRLQLTPLSLSAARAWMRAATDSLRAAGRDKRRKWRCVEDGQDSHTLALLGLSLTPSLALARAVWRRPTPNWCA